jgi:hypothetical protein
LKFGVFQLLQKFWEKRKKEEAETKLCNIATSRYVASFTFFSACFTGAPPPLSRDASRPWHAAACVEVAEQLLAIARASPSNSYRDVVGSRHPSFIPSPPSTFTSPSNSSCSFHLHPIPLGHNLALLLRFRLAQLRCVSTPRSARSHHLLPGRPERCRRPPQHRQTCSAAPSLHSPSPT